MMRILSYRTFKLAAFQTLAVLHLVAIPFASSAMDMGNMLMAQTLESFLSSLVSFGSMSITQKEDILRISEQFHQFNVSAIDLRLPQQDVFSSVESKEALRSYLFTEIDTDYMEYETAEAIASILNLGALYPRDSSVASIVESSLPLNGPAESSYTGEGNIVRLGRSSIFGLSGLPNGLYNGIWGYAVGSREYALQCHGNGLNILDVTDPSNIFRVQFVPMNGGGIWRDVATHIDATRNQTFAYVGAQGKQGDGKNPSLYAVDLSNLSGDAAHVVDENPCPLKKIGETPGFVHTINVDRGLLFLNTADAEEGCRVYDVRVDPWNPRFLFKTGGNVGRDCHDSSVIADVNGRDLLVVSDGSGRRQRIWDITDVDENWQTNHLPSIIGETTQISGIYAHSNWHSDDKRFIFCFDEGNQVDISVHDISDPTQPKTIGQFQYSEEAIYNGVPHNGEIRGQYLYIAYYTVGLRVFDVSNPYHPFEVGKAETFRDPNGSGTVVEAKSISDGAWNTYPFLPSYNILVSDMNHGLFVVKANHPYSRPGHFSITSKIDGSGNTVLSWTSALNARGYSVLRSVDNKGTFTKIAEYLTETSYIDNEFPFQSNYYRIEAINGSGRRASSAISSNGIMTKASKRNKLG